MKLESFDVLSNEQLATIEGGKGWGLLSGFDWAADQVKGAIKQYKKDYRRWH